MARKLLFAICLLLGNAVASVTYYTASLACDGTTDDQSALQAAATSCTNGGGGVIVISTSGSGSCNHSGVISFGTGCTMQCGGHTLKATTANTGTLQWSATTSGEITNCTIDSVAAARTQSNQGSGILCHACSNWRADNNTILNSAQAGIIADGAFSAVRIDHNVLTGSFADGFSCQNNGTNCEIDHNTATNSGDDSDSCVHYVTDPNTGATGCNIHDNTSITSKADCVRNAGFSNSFVTNNTCTSPASHGIIVAASAGLSVAPDTVTIQGNTISGVSTAGFNPLLYGGSNLTSFGNSVSNSKSMFISGVTHLTMTYDSFTNSSQSCIFVGNTNTDVNLLGVNANGCDGSGIKIAGTLTTGIIWANVFLNVQRTNVDVAFGAIDIQGATSVKGGGNQVTFTAANSVGMTNLVNDTNVVVGAAGTAFRLVLVAN